MKNLIVTTPVFRVAFLNLFKPKSYGGGFSSNPRYSALALFDEDEDLTAMKEEVDSCASWKFRGTDYRRPFKDGETRNVAWLAPYTMMNMSSLNKPLVRVFTPQEKMFLAEEKDIRNGDQCFAEIMFFAYDAHGHKGVSAALLSLTKVHDYRVTAEEAEYLAMKESDIINGFYREESNE